MTEEPESSQGTHYRPETPIPYNVEGTLQIGKSHHVIHFNSVQDPTEVNIDSETLYSPSGEEHDVPSQSSCLLPECANIHISGLR